MRKFVWICICFFVFLSFSYTEETDTTGLSRDEVNNIIGTWEENRKLVGRIGVDLFSWGIGAYIPNQSIIIDYVDETKKIMYVFQGGTTFYISAIKPLGLNKYQVDVYSPKELWGNHPEVRASLFFTLRSDISVFMNYSETWFIGIKEPNTLMVKISGPVIKMTEAYP